MGNPWIARMEQFRRFPEEDRRVLEELTAERHRHYGAREDIIREGEHSPEIHIVLSGLACRYKLLENGARQIMAFLVPGDPCDAEVFILKQMDHNIGALSPSLVAAVPGEVVTQLMLSRPAIALALWWSALQDEGILRERIIDEGRRDAYSRLAFLIYEVFLRLRAVGLAGDNRFDFPVTQSDLADATGLTPVHINRMLQRLREEELIAVEGRRWTIRDAAGLRKAANFSSNHLHFDRAQDEPDSEAAQRLKGLL